MFDHDVNRRVRHDRVVPEAGIAVNRSRDPPAELVVERRHRQNVDLVVDGADAVDLGHALRDLVAFIRHGHLSRKRDDTILHARADVVENRELRVAVHGCGDVLQHLQVFTRLVDRARRRQPRAEQQHQHRSAQMSKHVAPPRRTFRRGEGKGSATAMARKCSISGRIRVCFACPPPGTTDCCPL